MEVAPHARFCRHPRAASRERLHAALLTVVRPQVLAHGRVWSRHIKCPHRRDDYIAEMAAPAWKWFLRLAERNKGATVFPSARAASLARAARGGRRVAGQGRAKDVLSPVAQARHGFVVEKLPDGETLSRNPLTDALQDNTQTPAPAPAHFRLAFPPWRPTRADRNRRALDGLILGERAPDVSRKYRLSPGRVSQLRRESLRDWERPCGRADEAG